MTFIKIFLRNRVPVLFGPFPACPKLRLDRVSLYLLLGGDPRVNDGGLLLVCYCVRTHLFTTTGSNSLALVILSAVAWLSADKFIPGISEGSLMAFGVL